MIMKTTLVILFTTLYLYGYSQTEPSKPVEPVKTIARDTVVSLLTLKERALLQMYIDRYSNVQRQIESLNHELSSINDAYINMLRMKVETLDGLSNEWLTVKSDSLLYLKPIKKGKK